MELKVFWSRLAEDKLQDTFEYYKLKAGLKTSQKIIAEIIGKTDSLVKQPKIGAIEELLIERSQEFRCLISAHYKIIYYINHEKQRIVIANVFDTRQNPLMIQETKP